MKRIYIIGAGPGRSDLLTVEAQQAIGKSDCLIAHSRLMEEYRDSGKQLLESSSPKEIAASISRLADGEVISILVSGDTGFYSLTKSLAKTLEGLGQVEILSGISSIQYFCSKIQSSWDDAVLLSLHGREHNLVQKVKQNHKVLLLTDDQHTAQQICGLLCEYNLEEVVVTVGEYLSYEQERITAGSAKELSLQTFSPLSVVQIENPYPQEHTFLSDDAFIRGATPMTKQEVRCVSISKLQLQKNDVVFDIGAGTGSVAIEVALQIPDGKVYAIEKEADAVLLIGENKQKFQAANLEVRQGSAKELLLELPTPDKVFIGGSGGELCDILEFLYSKNPKVRVVTNAVTLETLCELTRYYQEKREYLFEVVQLSVAFTRKLGSYNLFTGQNPVYIITVSRKDASYGE